MSKVIVSREARKDLEGIRAYIRDDLANPDAARRIIGELKKSVLSLSVHAGGAGSLWTPFFPSTLTIAI